MNLNLKRFTSSLLFISISLSANLNLLATTQAATAKQTFDDCIRAVSSNRYTSLSPEGTGYKNVFSYDKYILIGGLWDEIRYRCARDSSPKAITAEFQKWKKSYYDPRFNAAMGEWKRGEIAKHGSEIEPILNQYVASYMVYRNHSLNLSQKMYTRSKYAQAEFQVNARLWLNHWSWLLAYQTYLKIIERDMAGIQTYFHGLEEVKTGPSLLPTVHYSLSGVGSPLDPELYSLADDGSDRKLWYRYEKYLHQYFFKTIRPNMREFLSAALGRLQAEGCTPTTCMTVKQFLAEAILLLGLPGGRITGIRGSRVVSSGRIGNRVIGSGVRSSVRVRTGSSSGRIASRTRVNSRPTTRTRIQSRTNTAKNSSSGRRSRSSSTANPCVVLDDKGVVVASLDLNRVIALAECIPNAKAASRIRELELPYKKGIFEFKPKLDKGGNMMTTKIGRQTGYYDIYNNIWISGPDHGVTKGFKEWDVQLSNKGVNLAKNKNLSEFLKKSRSSGYYININLQGNISH